VTHKNFSSNYFINYTGVKHNILDSANQSCRCIKLKHNHFIFDELDIKYFSIVIEPSISSSGIKAMINPISTPQPCFICKEKLCPFGRR